jgi:MFS family permease
MRSASIATVSAPIARRDRRVLARPRSASASDIVKTLFANWRLVVLGLMMSIMTTVCFYLVTAYTPTFGSSVLHLAAKGNLIVTLCVGACNFIVLPISGAVSDRIGRRRILMGCTIVALLTAYPSLLWLVHAPSFPRLLVVELWFSLFYATYNGAMAVFLTEIMPVAVGTSSFSLVYSLATAILGGFTPAICTYLIHVTCNRAVPGLWLSFAAICGLSAALALSPRKLQTMAAPG